MAVKFTNNAATTLAAGINSSVTSIAVTDGSVFPTITGSDHFYVTFDDTTNKEIVKVTARSGNTLTVVRGHDNTTARAFSSGDKAELRIVAALLEDVKTDVSSTLTVDTFTGDGSTTAFTLSVAPASEDNLIVFIEGVYQNPGDFTLSGTTLTLDVAPANSRKIIVYHVAALVSGNNLTHNQFTCNGSTTAFTLGLSPIHENNTQVFLDGVYQQKTDYAVSGTTLTMDTAPANGAILEVMTFTQTEVNTLPASFVSGLTEVTAVGADHFMIFDATDSALKKSLVSDVLESATSISTSADATAITIDSNEKVTFTSDVTTGGHLSVGGSNNELRFYEGSNYVGFEAPALSADKIWVLPAADGSNGQVISTDGSGNLSFATVSSGPTFKTFGTSSIMIGDDATGTINAANYNTGLGVDVFAALTEGDNNVVVGYGAGAAITTGGGNILIGGNGTGNNITTGSSNIAIGNNALTTLTSSVYPNIAIGVNALYSMAIGYQNTAIGYRAGESATGVESTLMGHEAGLSITSGNSNSYYGFAAGYSTTTGADNVAIGNRALLANTTGAENTAVGSLALDANTTGVHNVAIGREAMGVNTGGYENTCVGNQAGANITTGYHNVVLGHRSAFEGNNITTGIDNTLVGAFARTSSATVAGELVLGRYALGQGASTGSLGISGTGVHIAFNGSTTAWSAHSDERLKENIVDSTAGLSFINDLRPITYNWKSKKDISDEFVNYYDADSDEPVQGQVKQTNHGFIAQEVKAAIDAHPEIKEGHSIWRESPDGVQNLADGALIPMMVKAIQELSAKNDALEARITTLENA